MDALPSTFSFECSETLSYVTFTPSGKTPKAGWPLLVFLHGAGERGLDLESVYRHGPPKMIRKGAKIPAIVLAPQCKSGQIWKSSSLIALIDRVTETFEVNPDRILLTGISMGGYGTWALLSEYPERFAAAAPICGGGERVQLLVANEEKKKAAKCLPVWAIHGGDDAVVPPEEGERMVTLLKEMGNLQTRFTVYPGVGHDSWTRAYEEDGLVDWLLRFRRELAPGKPAGRPDLHRSHAEK